MTTVSLATFQSGVALGLAVAVPIGPMGLLCIQRTLVFGPVAGVATGLGAATVHLAFGSVAVLNLGTTPTAWVAVGAESLTFMSAGLLFWFAIRTLRRTTVVGPNLPGSKGWLHSYASAFLFGLSNPLTILLFVAALPALTVRGEFGGLPLLAAGVFSGSMAWWIFLSTGISIIRGRLSQTAIALTNRASGLAFAALGALMFASGCGLRP